MSFGGLAADEVVRRLDLGPHPEGGFFRETFRDDAHHEDRSHSTAIYYLLAAGDRSAWHRVDAVEIWHYYAGAALAMRLSADGSTAEAHTLGPASRQAKCRKSSCPLGGGKPPKALGPGRSAAARSRRDFFSRASSSRRRTSTHGEAPWARHPLIGRNPERSRPSGPATAPTTMSRESRFDPGKLARHSVAKQISI